MKAFLIALAMLGTAIPQTAQAYTVITDEHVDINVGLARGKLSGAIHTDSSGVLSPADTLLFDGPLGSTGLSSPGGIYSFLGVGAGETVYVWPQGGENDRIFMGFSAESIAPGTLASYYDNDPRILGTAPWIKISLAAVRYHAAPGESGPAHFSLWQSDPVGSPILWMSTFEGGITAQDAAWIMEGGHVHYNWGFSKQGYYEIDFVFSAYAAGSNTLLQSEAQTFHFGVEHQPPTIPEPSTIGLLCGAGLLLGRRRHRRKLSGAPCSSS